MTEDLYGVPNDKVDVIPGYDPNTDEVETSEHYWFTHDVTAARITRRAEGVKLKVVLPHAALTDPWPEEFLWRPLKALGVLDVWWSLYRVPYYPTESLEWLYQTVDGRYFTQLVSRELVADGLAFQAIQRHVFQGFLARWQDVVDSLGGSIDGGCRFESGQP